MRECIYLNRILKINRFEGKEIQVFTVFPLFMICIRQLKRCTNKRIQLFHNLIQIILTIYHIIYNIKL